MFEIGHNTSYGNECIDELLMVEIRHDTSNGGEYVTELQINELLQLHKYIIIGDFALDRNALYGEDEVARVLYKGDDEAEAKKVWLKRTWRHSRGTLYCQYGVFDGNFIAHVDLSDDYNNIKYCIPTNMVSYPLTIFPAPIEVLGELVYTKRLKKWGEDIWYVVRLFDIDLKEKSFVGQFAYKGTSKQEAVNVWNRSEEIENEFKAQYYIFNPAQKRVQTDYEL